MKDRKKYITEWKSLSNEADKAMSAGDMKALGDMIGKMEALKESYVENVRYEGSVDSSDFPKLNAIIESALPTLFVKNKKALSECMKTIMEDKNLKAQFKFLNALRSYDSDKDATGYINETLGLIKEEIDVPSLKASNMKLAKVIKKYSIDDNVNLNEDDEKFNENCSYLIETKKSVGNLMEYTNRINEMSGYMVANAKNRKGKVDVLKMAENVEKKLGMLNESEMELFSDIMGVKNKVNEQRQKGLFEKMRKSCIESIDKLLQESDSEEKERLLSLKETLLAKEFDKNTIVEDVAKLLEIGSILSQ